MTEEATKMEPALSLRWERLEAVAKVSFDETRRRGIENATGHWLKYRAFKKQQPNFAASRRHQKKISRHARALLDLLQSDEMFFATLAAWPEELNPAPEFDAALACLAERADRVAGKPAKRGRPPSPDAWFTKYIKQNWQSAGGKGKGFSWSDALEAPTGRLLDFVVELTAHAGMPLTPNAVYDLLRPPR